MLHSDPFARTLCSLKMSTTFRKCWIYSSSELLCTNMSSKDLTIQDPSESLNMDDISHVNVEGAFLKPKHSTRNPNQSDLVLNAVLGIPASLARSCL